MVYLGYLLVPLIWFYINRTRPGMHLRAVGENPTAADAMGINVYRLRYLYVFIGGALAGWRARRSAWPCRRVGLASSPPVAWVGSPSAWSSLRSGIRCARPLARMPLARCGGFILDIQGPDNFVRPGQTRFITTPI